MPLKIVMASISLLLTEQCDYLKGINMLNRYFASTEDIDKQQQYNRYKYAHYGELGSPIINPLLVRFLALSDIAVRWGGEGLPDSPNYQAKIPHIGFIATEQGTRRLLDYLARCHQRWCPDSEFWRVTFHQGRYNGDMLLPMITWSLATYHFKSKRKQLFNTLCEEYDLFFPRNI